MKKTIITSISLLLIFFYQIKAQQTYMPIFGENSTVFYTYQLMVDGVEFSKFTIMPMQGKNNCYIVPSGHLEISKDNSKMWRVWYPNPYVNPDTVKQLVMDLNLQKGEQFEVKFDPQASSQIYTVDSIFVEQGRKHVKFKACCSNDRLLVEGVTEELFIKHRGLEFMEGVGANNAYFYSGLLPSSDTQVNPDSRAYGVLFIRSQYKDDKLDYGNPDFYPYWGYYMPLKTIQSTNLPLEIYPNPVTDNLSITLPGSLVGKSSKIILIDSMGQTKTKISIDSKTLKIDMSNYPKGLFLVGLVNEKSSSIFSKVIKK